MPFQDAYERILEVTGTRTQMDVAAFLGVRQSSISDAKRRNAVPVTWLITLLNKMHVSPEWVQTGEGPRYLTGTDTQPQKLE